MSPCLVTSTRSCKFLRFLQSVRRPAAAADGLPGGRWRGVVNVTVGIRVILRPESTQIREADSESESESESESVQQ